MSTAAAAAASSTSCSLVISRCGRSSSSSSSKSTLLKPFIVQRASYSTAHSPSPPRRQQQQRTSTAPKWSSDLRDQQPPPPTNRRPAWLNTANTHPHRRQSPSQHRPIRFDPSHQQAQTQQRHRQPYQQQHQVRDRSPVAVDLIQPSSDTPWRPSNRRQSEQHFQAQHQFQSRTDDRPRPSPFSQQQGQPPPSRRQTRQQHSPTYPASPRPATKKTSPPPPKPKTEIYLPTYITVSDLARVLRVKLWDLQVKMRNMGHRDLRPDLTLPFSDAELIAAEHDLVAIANDEAAFDIYPRPPLLATSTAAEGSAAAAANLPIRPPIVTIMGHVDHGKTTLLDKLRSTSVAAGEAGGITQHIGAFSVPVVSSSSSSDSNAPQFVTFLDTPGHAAFTAMRSRGASVTDIVVLVVAADDGVMPQTREVIELWKDLASREAQFDPSSSTTTTTASARSNSDITESGTRTNRRLGSGSVQLVVALSKCDKPTADPERVKRELLSEGIELEEFGGEVPCVPVSGKTGEGLDLLQDTLVALAELAELRAEHDGPVEGYVIESRVEKGRGNVATVLVKRGALKVGDVGVAGQTWTKVRSLTSSSGASLRELKPGQAGIVTGWKELPSAGDEILGSAEGEAPAKKAVENRKRTAEARKLGEDVIKINEARRSVAEEAEKKKRAEWVERQQHRLAEAALSSGKSVAELIKETNDATAAAAAADAVATQDSSLEENAKEGEQAAVDSDKKELLLIVKADVSGSVEAVLGAVSDVGNKEAGVRIVSSGVGEPTDGDLAMARAVGARIICFNVPVSRSIERAAASQVPPTLIHSSPIIYRLMEYVSESVASLLPPLRQIRVTGEATIAQVFKINLKGRVFTNVAGCKITNGSVKRTSEIRILRNVSSASSASSSRQDDDEDDEEGDGGSGGGNEKTRDDSAGLQVGAVIGGGRKVVWIGKLDSLKHGKNEVPERGKGTECGMSFDGFQNFEEGDIVQAFYAVEVPRQLY